MFGGLGLCESRVGVGARGVQHTTHIGVGPDGARVLWHGSLASNLQGFVVGTEGVHWIRGYHTEDSEQGAALLAAYALTRPHA